MRIDYILKTILIALITFGFSFSMNTLNKTEIVENQVMDIEYSLKSSNLDNFSRQFNFDATAALQVDCASLGVAVYSAAIEQGYSDLDAYEMGYATVVTCVVLQNML